jgi:hypothetical protein
MNEIRLPQHVLNLIERRWASRFAQMLEDWQRPERAFVIRQRNLRSSSITASSAAAAGIPEAADGR